MNPSLKRISLWSAVILGLLALVFGLAYLGTRNTGAGGTLAAAPNGEDHTKGNANTKVTLVEYSDFQCPACAAYYPAVKQIAETYPNDVRVIYRHFPLRAIHPNGLISSKAAEAAARQNKFWEMHDVLFNTQAQWENSANPEEQFMSYAQSLGLNVDQFKTDMQSKDVERRVEKDETSGNASGVNATPTFFLNGKKIENPRPTYDDFKQIIDAALAA